MTDFSTELHTAAKAGIKTGLAHYLSQFKSQNLIITTGQFLGPSQKAI